MTTDSSENKIPQKNAHTPADVRPAPPLVPGADAEEVNPSEHPKTKASLSRKKGARREQLRQDRAKITRSLKRRIFLITALMNVSCLIIIACIYFLQQTNDPALVTLLWIILVIDVVFLSTLAFMIFRHYRLGKVAMKQQQKRQEAMRAKRLLRQYAKQLSKETQAQLMQQEGAGTAGLGMYLKLKKGELSNAIQFLCMTGRKGELALQFPAGKKAVLYLANNTVVHARIDDHSGVNALAVMLRQESADATFYEGKEAPEASIDMPVSQLLLEASVRSDEMAAE